MGMGAMPIEASNTDASARANTVDGQSDQGGLLQFGTINFASGGSNASAAATNSEGNSMLLWIGLAAVGIVVLILVLTGRRK